MIIGYGRVRIAVERYDGVDEIPHLFAGGVEYVCTIFVYVDALYALAIDVAAKLRTLVYYQTPLPSLAGKVSESGSEEAGADYKAVIGFMLKIYLE